MKPSIGLMSGVGDALINLGKWMLRHSLKIKYYTLSADELSKLSKSIDTPSWLWDRKYQYTDLEAWKKIIEHWDKEKRRYKAETHDCLAKDTEVIFINEDGHYDVKQLKEVKVGDRLLSYNFEKGSFEPDVVTKVINKGTKETYMINLSNGLSTVLTEDHKVFVWHCAFRRNGGKPTGVEEILEMRFGELRKRVGRIKKAKWLWQVLMAKKIPCGKVKDDMAWIKGLYVAEGWTTFNKKSGYFQVGIANNDTSVLEKAEKMLNARGIHTTYLPRRKNSGAYIVASDRTGYGVYRIFAPFGRKAIEKTIPPYALSYDEKTLKEFLDGYYTGDGTKRPSNKNVDAWYNTTSKNLVTRLFVCHLILGRPLRVYCIRNHGGLGKHPIYRLVDFRNSTFKKNAGKYTNLTHSTFTVEENGKENVIDITMAKNHNFVLANGQIVHNCDNFSLSFNSFCSEIFDLNSAGITLGAVLDKNNNVIGYHAWTTLIVRENNKPVLYCYEPQGGVDMLKRAEKITNMVWAKYKSEMVIFG